jgi:hypothetical protein
MVAFAWFGAWNLWPFLTRREARGRIVLAGLVSLVVIAGGFLLRVFPPGSGVLRFGLHPAAKYGPVYFLVDFGPLFLFGALGLYLCLRCGMNAALRSMALLLAVGVFLAFCVTVDIEPNHLIRKAIKPLELALVVFAVFACSRYLDLWPRYWIRVAGALAILAGFVTLCTDIFQYIDVESERRPQTTYISPDRMQAMDWIRTRTAKDALVQRLDEVRPGQILLPTGYLVNAEFDNSIPGLAERRTLFGNLKWCRVTHVADGPMGERRAILERVFTSPDAATLNEELGRLPRCYLVLDCKSPGPVELVQRLVASGELEVVFQAGSFRVLLPTDRRGDAPTLHDQVRRAGSREALFAPTRPDNRR